MAFFASFLARKSQLGLPAPAWAPAVDIDPSYLPQPAKLEGVYQENTRLTAANRIFDGKVNGSESVAVAPDSSLYVWDRTGLVFRASSGSDGQQPVLEEEPVAFVNGGRPLGSHFDADGNLIWCHPPVGLVKLDTKTKAVTLLTSSVTGVPLSQGGRINYANDLDIASDGTIYFTDSTVIPPALTKEGFYDTLWSYVLEALQGGATGRLLKYDPQSGRTSVVATGFWFANGVALSADGSFAAVAETVSMRVRRVWLSGPKAGTVDTLIQKLPAHPDGVSRAPDGGFWVALVAPPQPILQAVMPYRWLRSVVAWAITVVRPPLKDVGMVLKVSASGEPQQFFMDPEGRIAGSVASAVQHGSRLYLGNLNGNYLSTLDLKFFGDSSTA